jgi:mRNA-degrading endonuclease toxin of MazEF toxin-antitoxin module
MKMQKLVGLAPEISFDFGDIVLVPFPFTDQTGAKKRPAVVVGSQTLHREGIEVVIMAMTTQSCPASSLEDAICRNRLT